MVAGAVPVEGASFFLRMTTITLGALAVLAVAGATFSYMLVMRRKKDAPSTGTAPATMNEPYYKPPASIP